VVPVCRVAWIVLGIALLAPVRPVAHAEPRAEPRIIVVETRGAPPLPALASQVATQVGGRASVQARAEPDADPMSYAERASRLVASGDAAVVVWVAPVEDGFLVFASGGWPGRAVIELVRVDADLGPAELERTVALKIAGLLDAMLAPYATARGVLGVPDPARPAWQLELAGAIVREPHERGLDGRVALAVARRWPRGAWGLAPVIAGYWQPTGAIEGLGGRASLTEIGAVIALEVDRDDAGWQVVARPRVTAGLLDARGVSNDGRRGGARVISPQAGFELGIRRAVSGPVRAGLLIGCDVALIHHELAVDDETVIDAGWMRVHVSASLTVAL
jgi:hypothetical protein